LYVTSYFSLNVVVCDCTRSGNFSAVHHLELEYVAAPCYVTMSNMKQEFNNSAAIRKEIQRFKKHMIWF